MSIRFGISIALASLLSACQPYDPDSDGGPTTETNLTDTPDTGGSSATEPPPVILVGNPWLMHLDFEEISGATLQNRVANSLTGKLYGVSRDTGKSGLGVRFDGSASIRLFNSAKDDFYQPDVYFPDDKMTVMFWFRPASYEPGIKHGLFRADEVEMGIRDGVIETKLRFYQSNDELASLSAIPTNEWHHVALVIDQGTFLYVDGALVDESDKIYPLGVLSADLYSSFTIGEIQPYYGEATAPYIGDIDDFYFSNIAVPISTILSIYSSKGLFAEELP